MKDTYGRTIDYLRVSLTDRCNLRCIYCMPEDGVAQISHNDILRLEEFERIVRVAAQLGIRNIRLTGGEPLVRKGIVSFVERITAIPGIENVSLTTNGVLLPLFAKPLKEAGLGRVNISLDTLDAAQYREVTRCGALEDALRGIDAALDTRLSPVKVNMVTVRRLNQDYLAFARMSVDRPLHVRFIEYMPVGESGNVDGCGWDTSDVVPSQEVLQRINDDAQKAGLPQLRAVDADGAPFGCGPARYYAFPDAQGTVGFISALSNHFCSACNRVRLTADGKLRPCLFSDDEFDMRTAVREGSDDDIRAVFERAVQGKPDGHNDRVGTARRMSAIGG